ncbi:hypothetical protein SAMN05443667_101275 [Flavobacterium gillisiae]|uniref:Uncharacterized protein n=1 Tax=Flavobacterium gillisiae TaxID=150146 RepID=A0A1H3WWK5_9FLAO|nr:hypothetical protein [Flavobacterium gillisiae]SDZ91519.1 hypothetical protein SAMN05443667_101275 [Flavobacterium gillisiae]
MKTLTENTDLLIRIVLVLGFILAVALIIEMKYIDRKLDKLKEEEIKRKNNNKGPLLTIKPK